MVASVVDQIPPSIAMSVSGCESAGTGPLAKPTRFALRTMQVFVPGTSRISALGSATIVAPDGSTIGPST